MLLNEASYNIIADCKAGKIKYVIFDRDGTLTQTSREEGGYITKLGQIQAIDGVKEALNHLVDAGADLFVFTQQKCVGKGLVSEATLAGIHAELNAQIAPAVIKDFKYCPHIVDDNCSCMKPQPQMISELIESYNIQPEEVLVAGDNPRDFECAKNAGIGERFIYIADDLGRHKDVYAQVEVEGGLFFESVKAMVDHLFAR